MNKDVIYIDVEDDITAVISKVKQASEKIVALVPPKRPGIFQSAVNLRLLNRAASEQDKRLVLISSNQALMALAAAAKIPVARNLQSKPELAQVPVIEPDDEEDVIDGSQLPVGELEKTADLKPGDFAIPAIDAAVSENAAEEPVTAVSRPSRRTAVGVGAAAAAGTALYPKSKAGSKVPNFTTFRKRLFLFGALAALLIAFFIWAIVFAPRATVVITAQTTDNVFNSKVTVGPNETTSLTNSTLQAVQEQATQSQSVSFTPTGTKNVGTAATGTVVISNCESSDAETIPAGTVLTSNNENYTLDSSVTVPGGTGSFSTGCVQPGQSSSVGITASDVGDSYNQAANTQFSVAGHASSLSATTADGISGGTSKQVTVATASDVQSATQQLTQLDSSSIKKSLEAKFGSNVRIIDASFTATPGTVTSSPAVGTEVDTPQAKITATVTYTILGVEKDQLDAFLNPYFASQISGSSDQYVYSNGDSSATFTNVAMATNGTASTTLNATGKIGPKISDSQVKKDAEGKKLGEVQSDIGNISGVSDVTVKFSPFWVDTVPSNPNHITIQFKINGTK